MFWRDRHPQFDMFFHVERMNTLELSPTLEQMRQDDDRFSTQPFHDYTPFEVS
jgi:hypothetical protein